LQYNQSPLEIRKKNVNQDFHETHSRFVNQRSIEAQETNVNHRRNETHSRFVNYRESETHVASVNQRSIEAQETNVNHRRNETHRIVQSTRKSLSMPVYAVNVADLSAQVQTKGQMCPPMLMLSDLLTKETIKCEGDRADGDGLLLDVEPERMEAILDILRNGLGRMPGIPKNLLRIYMAKNATAKTWKRV